MAFRLDAEDINQVQALFDTIIRQNERITAVIHNVGEIFPQFLRSPLSFLLKCGNPLFIGLFSFSKLFKIFKEQNHGTLIFTGASASLRGKPFSQLLRWGNLP